MTKLDAEQFDKHYPQLTYETGLFMIDYLRRVNREFENDLTACVVLGEIAQHNIRGLMREKLPRSGLPSGEFATREIVAANLRRCNAHSVAEASGIPRETVRRKIEKLVDWGYITRDAKGGLALKPGVSRHFKAFDRQTIVDLCALAERVRRIVAKG